MLVTSRQKELLDLRNAIGLTQVQMAEAIEMPVRTYQTLEGGPSVVKPWHLKAARYAAMEHVIGQPKSELVRRLPADIVDVARSIALYDRDMSEREAPEQKRTKR